MRKICALILLFIFLSICTVMAEENSTLSSLTAQARSLIDEGNYAKGISLLEEAAAQDNLEALNELGRCYKDGLGVEQNSKESEKYYKRAADLGFAPAQYNLGVMYSMGDGTEQNYEEAVRYYRLAADQGFMYAIHNLGRCYMNGFGVKKDIDEGMRLYELAAEKGDYLSAYNLGMAYYIEQPAKRDYDKAFFYFRQAADANMLDGIFAVGECYYKGIGVEPDFVKAAEWYKKALDAGYKPDEEDLKHLADVLEKLVHAVSAETDAANEGNSIVIPQDEILIQQELR